MGDTLKIALIQTDLVWENPEENRILLTNKLIELNDTIDLIILPEMFSTGFSMNASQLFETSNGDTVTWMQEMASQKGAAIVGSLIIKENETYFNRLFFVHPDGELNTYDKRHTFSLAGEHEIYQRGSKKLIVNFRGFKICPQICYDLRFPAWSRNTEDFDVLIYVANWPKVRIKAWTTLLQARAIENMVYCAGVNRLGTDGNGHQYSGQSAVYNYLGEQIDQQDPEDGHILIAELNKKELIETRSKLNFLADRDQIVVS